MAIPFVRAGWPYGGAPAGCHAGDPLWASSCVYCCQAARQTSSERGNRCIGGPEASRSQIAYASEV
jgi:hypothetical protein